MDSDASQKEPMHKIILHLIQLQELMEARAQQEASSPGSRMEQLDQSIQTLFSQLPLETATLFKRLEQRSGGLVVVPISASRGCSACGMSLPTSLVHEVHAAHKLYTCPSCARILYYAESLPRNIGRRRQKGQTVAGIERFSTMELMIPRLTGNTREEVLGEFCSKMEAEGYVDNGARLLDEALRREAIVSTAVGHGLAFPHVRSVEGGGLTLSLGLHPKGVRFDPAARTLTRIFFFMVIPTAASAFYLKLLAGLSQVFRDETARDKLLEASESAEKLWKALIKATKTTIR